MWLKGRRPGPPSITSAQLRNRVAEPHRTSRLRRQPPPALVVSFDVQATGVVSAAAELGLRIPTDLGIVSVDGTRAAAYGNPAITTLSQPIERMAGQAVETILARQTEPVHAVICESLTVRRSCGC
jgi:LacI family transcriptional regulator